MTGRGIDQVMAHPGGPVIYEYFLKSAEHYVELAEGVNGPLVKPVDFSYIWGDSLEELELASPDLRIINLETAITTSDDFLDKGINYRMNPGNIPCLTAAKIDFCALANNHVLDWGRSGLIETMETLDKAGIKYAGAGRELQEAETPAIMDVKGKGRVIVFSFGTGSSGIPSEWAAGKDKPGVNLLEDLSGKSAAGIGEKVRAMKQSGDIVVASLHWGGNWGYEIQHEQRAFAHKLIDDAGIDVIHGHSSHHFKAVEMYKGKLILYGCGDFINDYEGISGYEIFRSDLGLMYFADIDPVTGKLLRLRMKPTQIRRFRVNRASVADALWIRDVLNRECKKFGTAVDLDRHNTLLLRQQ